MLYISVIDLNFNGRFRKYIDIYNNLHNAGKIYIL